LARRIAGGAIRCGLEGTPLLPLVDATLFLVFVVHPTKKLLDRLRRIPEPSVEGTTALGDWYATVLFWKPQVALFVNEQTLLPVLVPLAPAATLLDRFPGVLRDVLQAQEIPRQFAEAEVAEMGECHVVRTSNRSVLGSMNEFSALAGIDHEAEPDAGLLALSLRLAEVPCGPLFKRHVTPGDELRAFVGERRG
jgi:hypothetical protein